MLKNPMGDNLSSINDDDLKSKSQLALSKQPSEHLPSIDDGFLSYLHLAKLPPSDWVKAFESDTLLVYKKKQI